jgi:outer membrane lipopolysaccharide assembly protein LptE/RlpB
MKHFIALLFWIIALFVITSCGFHIRDYQELSPKLKVLSIKSNKPHSSLKDILSANFQGRGNALDSKANYTLVIRSENFSTSKNTIGTAEQLNSVGLSYNVTVVLLDNTGNEVVPETAFTSSTNYLQNANQILGDISTTSSLEHELMRNMAHQIMNYLTSQDIQRALSYHH